MLQDIRQASKSGLTYILVGVLVVVFAVFFGAPLDSCGSNNARRRLVAEVGATKVYTDDVNIIFNRIYGGRRSVDESQVLTQQATSLRALLLIHLLAERGMEAGIRVDDDEFKRYIKDPFQNFEFRFAYGQSGGFDGKFYKNYVQYQLRSDLTGYEEFKRTELLARKYMTTLEMQYVALPSEIEALHKLRNTQVDLEFAKFDPAKIQELVPVTDADVATYVAANQAAVKKYYDDNKAKYEDAAKIRLRRIFILKPSAEEGDDKVEAAKKKFEDAKARVQKEDFATVAGEITEDYAKEKQGLMDWTTLENLDQNIAKVIKGAKVNEVKEVETNFAYMLVRLEEEKAAKTTPLADVSNEIARLLVQESKVKGEVERLGKSLFAKMATAKTLEEAVTSLKNEPVVAVDGQDAPTSVWNGVMVAKTGKFSLEGQDLAALFGGQFPGMGRAPWDRIQGIGKSSEVALDAFNTLTMEKPLSTKTYNVDGAFFIVRLAEREEATPEKLKETEGTLNAEIRGTKAGSALGAWPALFSVPQPTYGPYLENLLDESIKAKKLKLYEKNYDAIPLMTAKDVVPVEAT